MKDSELLSQAFEFAHDRLGSASLACLQEAEVQAALQARLRQGPNCEDATLAILFTRVRTDRVVANEFFSYLLGDLSVGGRSLLAPPLRGLIETAELVDSVVHDLWKDLESVEFRTRGQFLAFLLRRMQWKRTNQIRAAQRAKRGGGRISEDAIDLVELPDRRIRSPLSEAEHADDLRRLAKLSARLEPGDREVLEMRLVEGRSYTEIGANLGISANTAKSRIEELLQRLRQEF